MLFTNLHEYLILHGKVSIPGLGQFERKLNQAFFAEESGQLIAPKNDFLFSSTIFSRDNWEKFKQFVARKKDLPLQQVEGSIQRELSDLETLLSSGEKLDLYGLGTLSIDDKSNELTFIPTSTSKSIIPPLEAIVTRKILREETIAQQVTPNELIKPTKTSFLSKFWRELGMGFLLFFIVAMIYYLIQFSTCSPATKITNPLVELTHIDESRLNQDPVEFINSHGFKDSNNNISEIPLEAGQVMEDSSYASTELIVEPDSMNLEINQESAITLNDDCVIILGSFLKHNLASKLKLKLEQQGLTIYTGTFGDFQRIGVYEPCDQLSTTLEQYRKTVESDAWILQ
jgi:nucleoid DNA-binding protein